VRLVVVESPYAGDVERNLRYLRAAMADCLARGEAPFASHGLYTQPGVLDDTVPSERRLGMDAGFAWGERADAVVVYEDLGVTPGMLAGIARAEERGQPVERRRVPGWDQRLETIEDYRGALLATLERLGVLLEWADADSPDMPRPQWRKDVADAERWFVGMSERAGFPLSYLRPVSTRSECGPHQAAASVPDSPTSDPDFDSDPDDGGD
jgi:hypothetical protein